GSYVQLSLQDPAGVIRQGALDLLVLFVIGLAGFLGLLGNRQRGLLRGRRKLRRKRSAGVGIPGQGQDGVGSTTHDHQNGDDGEGTLVPLPLALLLVQLPFQGFHEMLVYLAHLFLSRMPLFRSRIACGPWGAAGSDPPAARVLRLVGKRLIIVKRESLSNQNLHPVSGQPESGNSSTSRP